MTTKLQFLPPLFLALVLPLAAGEPATTTTKSRVIVHADKTLSGHAWVHADGDTMAFKSGDESEMGSRTFLGVETTRVGATLGKQLGLDRGVGLVVARVVPESGAMAVLEKHDLLVKFEDQLLISPEQLGVLVQAKAPGTAVELTVMRGGQERLVTATLGEKKAKSVFIKHGNMALPASAKISRDEVKGLFADADGTGQGLFVERREGDTATIKVMNINRGSIIFTDDEGTVKLISDDDSRRLVVLDEEDQPLFDGPVDTAEQRDALSETLRERLEKVESIRAMEMSDQDFEVEEDVQLLVPHASHHVEIIEVPRAP